MNQLSRWMIIASLVMAGLNCYAYGEGDTVTVSPLPGNSIYQFSSKLTDQDGHTFTLSDKRGKPVIISMFYNSCQFVCPMLIDTVRNTEESLTPEQRARLSVILVTFDPARDTVAVLKSISDKRQLDTTQWAVTRTDDTAVRKLAALLGIQYRLLDNGDYNHTTALILLDSEGRIIGRSDQIGEVDPRFVTLLQKATQAR